MSRLSKLLSRALARPRRKTSAVETPSHTAATWQPRDPASSTWSEILSTAPLVIHALPSSGFPLGSASVIGPLVRERNAHFLIMPAHTIEPPDLHRSLINSWTSYLTDHPRHYLHFLGNTDRETQIMAGAGFDAVTLNQNCLVNDSAYFPLPEIEPIYDAVYNARFSPRKRLELAVQVERLALVYFYNAFELTIPQFHAEHARSRALMPHATFINRLTPEGCEWLSPRKVNEVLAHSRIGLCLSPREGAMRASIEYLFAGLSVVSTPSLGGRDQYFDDQFCIIAEADPRSVREAVDSLVARAVPREYVRSKTLARVEADRARYIGFVQELIDGAGGTTSFEEQFWTLLRGDGIMRWRSMSELSATVLGALQSEARIASRDG